MSDQRIRAAFETALATWAAAQSPALPVVYQHLEPDQDTQEAIATKSYVRAWIMPAPDKCLDMAGKHREYSGIFQVDLCLADVRGHGAATEFAASLDDTFDTDAPLENTGLKVWITLPMTEGPAREEDSHYVVPVYCAYQAHSFKS